MGICPWPAPEWVARCAMRLVSRPREHEEVASCANQWLAQVDSMTVSGDNLRVCERLAQRRAWLLPLRKPTRVREAHSLRATSGAQRAIC